jgi:hypothetical protein
MPKRLKDMIKKNPEPSRPSNVDPGQLGQYSATNQVSEDGSLSTYLSSRGIDPKSLSRDSKISHAKSNEFKTWKQNHMFEEKLTEESLLDKFLSARGFNPAAISRNKKISYAKSAEFLNWSRSHMKEGTDSKTQSPTQSRLEILKKAASKHNVIDTPRGAMKREGSQTPSLTPEAVQPQKPTALQRFRNAVKQRDEKHAQIKQSKDGSGMTSAIDRLEKHLNKEETQLDEMDQKFIDSLNKLSHKHKEGDRVTVNSKFFGKQKGKVVKVDNQSVHVQRDGKTASEKYPHDAVMKEEVEQIEETGNGFTHDPWKQKYFGPHTVVSKRKMTDKEKADWEKHKEWKKGVDAAIASDMKRINKEEVEQIDELNYDTVKSLYTKRREMRDDASKKSKEVKVQNVKTSTSRLFGSKSTQNQPFDKVDKGTHYELKPKNEDVGDAKAAVHADGQTAAIDQMQAETKRKVNLIKSIYKNKRMVKEDLNDHEKEDKSVATYGKKPKFEKAEKDEGGENKPTAAATLTGGSTLTGEKRDDVEIDPMMRVRPGQPDPFKKDDKKKDGKDGKKEEKK